MTRPTETLLTPRLLAAASDFATGLGLGVPTACRSELSRDDLVQNVEVGLDPEHLGVQLDVAVGGTVCLEKRGLDVSHEPSPPL